MSEDSKPTRWDTEARAICVKLIPHTTSVHNAMIVADAIAAARADERERCAAIVRLRICDEHATVMLQEIENG